MSIRNLSVVSALSVLVGVGIAFFYPLCKDCISIQIVNKTPQTIPNVNLYFDGGQGVTGRFNRASLSPGASSTFTIFAPPKRTGGGVPFRIEALDTDGKVASIQRGYAYKDQLIAIN
jgi:hypothetical protein